MIPLPRLFINGKFSRIIHPISVTLTENIIPLSTATMELPEGEELPIRSYVEIFNPYGSAGMYRVRAPEDGYGGETSIANLDHMIVEVGDFNVKAEISKMMPATTAVKTLFSHYKGGKWKLGKYTALGTGNVAVEAEYDSVLTAILSVLNQRPDCMMTFDFTTTPWTINIVKKGSSVVAQGRLARNVTSAKVSMDESTLVTRLWYQTWSTDDDGNAVGTWTHKDASTLKDYGVIEDRVDTSYSMTAAEINYMVDTFLQEHKQPRTSVSIQATELYRITGETMDRFIVGDLFRLAIPKRGVTVELNITSISWGNVYDTPGRVIVHLGDDEDTVVSFLHNLDATGAGTTGGSGGGRGKAKSDAEWKEFISKWDVQDDRINGFVKKVDKQGKILEAAGLQINSKGVLIYADNGSKQSLYSRFKVTNDAIKTEVTNRQKLGETMTSSIKQEANRISMVVETKDGTNKIKVASIVTAINKDESTIKLLADRIDLSGYVTASALETVDGRISNLVGGNSTFTHLQAQKASLGSGNNPVFIYGQQVRAYAVKDTNGTTRQVFGYTL